MLAVIARQLHIPIINYQEGYDSYQLVETDLTKPGLFALYQEYEGGYLDHVDTYMIRNDAKSTIRKLHDEFLETEHDTCYYVLVKLDTLDLEFSSDREGSAEFWIIKVEYEDIEDHDEFNKI